MSTYTSIGSLVPRNCPCIEYSFPDNTEIQCLMFPSRKTPGFLGIPRDHCYNLGFLLGAG